jgi:NNP family nitrate/nitrite transporter-like MFS transporter
MKIQGFFKSGHTPTLFAALMYFDVSFMVWVLLGPLAPFISEQLKLNPAQKGLMLAVPLLGGAFFRVILGVLSDRLGSRKTGLLGLTATLIPLLIGWKFAHTLPHFYLVGLLLGIAGASFAVALPLAGAWYPPEHQGLAMGITGAGNSGTLIATLFAPRLAQAFGWNNTFALAAIPVLLVLVLFAALAKDSPHRPKAPAWADYMSVVKESDIGWFCMLYSLTFGGFVGLASFLTVFFNDQFHLSKVRAGDFTTIVVVAGSFLRPVGGFLADKIGGYRLLLILLLGVGGCLAVVGWSASLPLVVVLLFLGMGMLGMGNGAVFQLVPQRFPERVGILTGLVGAAGGLGGFFLPSFLGIMKFKTGTYSTGLLLCAVAYFAAQLVLLQLGARWGQTWQEGSVKRAGIFCYRKWVRGLAGGNAGVTAEENEAA